MSVSPLEDIEDAASIFKEAGAGGFAFSPVGLGDVELAVKHFSSQACGENEIPQSVISKAPPFIGPHLVKFFYASLAQGGFPKTWRRGRLLALKKVSVPSTPSDFRPIALPCFLSKVLEKLAHDHMTSYLEESGLLDLMQTGFRKYNSTETALVKLTDDIRMGIDRKMVTFLFFF